MVQHLGLRVMYRHEAAGEERGGFSPRRLQQAMTPEIPGGAVLDLWPRLRAHAVVTSHRLGVNILLR